MGALSLPAAGLLYLDACCVIYRVEQVEPYHTLLGPVFAAAKTGTIGLVTSELSLMECLVKPARAKDVKLEELFRAVLTGSREIRLQPITSGILERGIRLRAEQGLKTPDAIHAATALEGSCTTFLTNDAAFQRISELEVQVLHESLEEA